MTRAHLYRRRRLRRESQTVGPSMIKMVAILAILPLLLLLGSCSAILISGLSYYSSAADGTLKPEDAIAARGGGARIYDRNGTLLYRFLDERYGEQDRIPLSEVSPHIIDATIAAEDASFYDNPGVNVKGLARAAVENLQPGDTFLEGSGGSSITQQLVKQLYFTLEERQERSVTRKLREAALAIRITRDYDKDQILEWYLNEIPYGGLLTGVQAASYGLFGIPAKDVTLAQAAFLAGLPQSPADYDPFTHMDAAKARQYEVLDLMVKHHKISEGDAAFAKLETITLNPTPRPFLAPHFVEYVADYIKSTLGEDALYHGGLEVLTTLDLKLNTKVNEILESHLETYEQSSGGHNGSVVIISPPTGQILAMVGSRDYNRDDIDGRVNNATAVNSPGSTLKPFTYATALMQGWSPDWPIVDTPITYTESDGSKFSPRNPNGGYKGIVKMKDALGNSYNIPAFKTILWAGVPNVVTTAKRMGITTLDRDLGPALTLGGVDVKLLDMVYGYSAFANGGEMAGMPTTAALPEGNRKLDPIPVLAIRNQHGDMLVNNTDPKKERVLGEEYAWMISDILSTDANRSSTYGRGSNLNIPGHTVAAKTGTSEPYADTKRLIGDTWTFGYTPDFAVGVWVGNSDNTPMVNILSTTIAGSTWHDTFVELLKDVPDKKFVRPDDKLVEATVCVPSGRIPVPGKYCPTVKGIFAKEALAHAMDPKWWGGQELQNPLPLDSRDIPPEVVDWKRKLAQEYQGRYGGGGGGSTPRAAPTPQNNQPEQQQQQQPAPAPTAAVEPPQPTPAPEIFPGRNGNGRRNR